MVYFDFRGTVEVSMTHTTAPFTSAVIRPYSYGIVPKLGGNNTLKFILNDPRNLVIQVNGNIFGCLHLLSSTIETSISTGNSSGVIYFGPGIHSVSGGVLNVCSGQTV